MKLQIMMWRMKLVNLEKLGTWETLEANSERHKAQTVGVLVLRKAWRPQGPWERRPQWLPWCTWGPKATEHRAARSGTGSGCPSPAGRLVQALQETCLSCLSIWEREMTDFCLGVSLQD